MSETILPPPKYWSRSTSSKGDVLTYAIREGTGYFVLLAIAVVMLLGGAWGMYWLASGGGLTVAGIVLLLLVPGGAMLFGVYSLDAALWRRQEYLLGLNGFEAHRHSLFGGRLVEIHRSAIEAISQAYSPPRQADARSAKGDWVTFVVHRNGTTGKITDYALDGMKTEEEARWLGSLLSQWAKVPLKRGFGAEFEEADPNELPKI